MNQSDMEVIEMNARQTGSYAGALLLILPVIPIVATIVSIVTFVVSHPPSDPSAKLIHLSWFEIVTPVLAGTVSALLLWLLLAWIFRRLTTVQRANEQSYYALLNHLSLLNSYLPDPQPSGDVSNSASGGVQPSGGAVVQPVNKGTSAIDSKQEVMNCREAIYLALKERSTSWVLGNGYIELWDLMDSAEEALVMFAPPDKVVGDAVYDEMRLNDSKIENSQEWANKLRLAVKALDSDAVRYLKPAVGAQSPGQDAQAQPPTPAVIASPPASSNMGGIVERQPQAEARAILRKVRKAINDYNTTNWDALISARNQLLSTMVLVGLTAYVFIETAILIRINPLHIEVATIFALVGALAGLISRIYSESQSESTIDDYRLSMARLLVTPLLSALAAVIGVFVVAKATDLNEIFSFKTTGFVPNLIIAATFGLTPNLLLNQLLKKSEGYKADLQSTQPTSGK